MEKMATSGSIEGIKKLITDFYCGEDNFTLEQIEPKKWKIIKNNKTLSAYVIKKGKRYIFGY